MDKKKECGDIHKYVDITHLEIIIGLKTYKEKYKSDPDNFAIHGYDAAMIVVDAIKRAGSTDGTKVAEAIAKTKDLPVATGKVTLDKDHNPTSGAVIIALKGGVQTFVEKITL